jgi:hypothetical protein
LVEDSEQAKPPSITNRFVKRRRRADARRIAATTTIVEVAGVGHTPSLVEPEALSVIKHFLAR